MLIGYCQINVVSKIMKYIHYKLHNLHYNNIIISQHYVLLHYYIFKVKRNFNQLIYINKNSYHAGIMMIYA